jgi:hypothetical protein
VQRDAAASAAARQAGCPRLETTQWHVERSRQSIASAGLGSVEVPPARLLLPPLSSCGAGHARAQAKPVAARVIAAGCIPRGR